MGNCLFLRAQGWGMDRQMRTKLQIPGGMPGGGMVTGRIEPCIRLTETGDYLSSLIANTSLILSAQTVPYV